jgi:type III secretory pathway component EscS
MAGSVEKCGTWVCVHTCRRALFLLMFLQSGPVVIGAWTGSDIVSVARTIHDLSQPFTTLLLTVKLQWAAL